jgi:hypothetical protein
MCETDVVAEYQAALSTVDVEVVVIAAFNAFYWLPIRGELPSSAPAAK